MNELDFYRIIFSFISGYFLCASGSIAQLLTHNPLASPSTLGMSGFAVLFVLLAQLIQIQTGTDISLSYLSFCSFTAFMGILYLFIRFRFAQSLRFNLMNLRRLILLGLACNLFIGAIFSIVQFLFMALNFEFPSGLWFGHFKFYQEKDMILVLISWVAIVIFIFRNVEKFELLNLGGNLALSVKPEIGKFQLISIWVILFMTGLVISFFGVFSFLGLIFPHIIRKLSFFNSNIKSELIWGPILSGSALAIIDYFCFKIIFYGAELPVGMVSSVLGAFLLIFLIVKER